MSRRFLVSINSASNSRVDCNALLSLNSDVIFCLFGVTRWRGGYYCLHRRAHRAVAGICRHEADTWCATQKTVLVMFDGSVLAAKGLLFLWSQRFKIFIERIDRRNCIGFRNSNVDPSAFWTFELTEDFHMTAIFLYTLPMYDRIDSIARVKISTGIGSNNHRS